MYHHESLQPPDDLLEQRQELLAFLTSTIKELSRPHMPEAQLPVTCLECPYHEDCLPHIQMDIATKEVLVCNLDRDVKIIDQKCYLPLYELTTSTPQDTGKCVLKC